METAKIEELYETLLSVQQSRPETSPPTERFFVCPHVLSRFFSLIAIDDQVLDTCVLDLGTGSGSLAIGASLVGAGYVLGVDCDERILKECSENVQFYQRFYGDDGGNIDLMKGDVTLESFLLPFDECFDVVLMNPPSNLELPFVKAAFSLHPEIVYAILSPEVRNECKRMAKEAGMICSVIATLNIQLDDTVGESKELQRPVDIVKFEHPKSDSDSGSEDFQGGSQDIDESDLDSDDGKECSQKSDDLIEST